MADIEPPSAGSKRRRSRARGLAESWLSPRLVASRRDGSMVQTSTRRPLRAARRPRAAAVVVLPTPPEPHTTITRRSASAISSASAGERRRGKGASLGSAQARRELTHVVGPELLAEQVGERDERQGGAALGPALVEAGQPGPAELAPGGAHGAPGPEAPPPP